MKILEVLDRVNAYLPHGQFTVEEIINWCDELGAKITQEIKKMYGFFEIPPHSGEGFLLPKFISFEMVESIRTPNGETISKIDFRSFDLFRENRMHCPVGSILVYLMKYQRVRNITWVGSITKTDNGIVMTDPPFVAGDILNITVDGAEIENVNLLEVEPYSGGLDEYLLILGKPVNGGIAEITRLITEETECPPPYDAMYINYVLAQMAFMQQDYDRYNAQTGIFNRTYDAYAAWYKERSPINKSVKLINYW